MKNKYKKTFIGFLVLFMVLISNLSFNTIPVKADSNYSNYLTNESISVKNDRALILLENSGSSNNYRNYYETGFLFPSKLRDEMYSTELTTNPAKYYIQQAYLDNLDSEYSFSDIENLGQYQTNDYIENYTDIVENVGNYNNTEFIENDMFYIYPNSDLLDNWHVYPLSTHYTAIDDLNIQSDYIYGKTIDGWDKYGIENFDNIFEILDSSTLNITLNIWAKGVNCDGGRGDIRYLLLGYDDNFMVLNSDNYVLYTIEFTDKTLAQLNNMELWIQVLNEFIGDVFISSIYFNVSFNNVYNENTLQNSDNNYYNYLNNGTGISGLFPAEYSFTDDSNGSNPSGWNINENLGTVNVISGIDSHNKVVECYSSGNGNVGISKSIAQTSGTYEYWIRPSQTNKVFYMLISDGTGDHAIFMNFRGDGWIVYHDGAEKTIQTYNANQWYHFRILFDCGATWQLWIDEVDKGTRAYRGNPAEMDLISFVSTSDFPMTTHIDAVDNSDADGYYTNRNLNDSSYNFNITSNLTIERKGNSFDNLENLELQYTVKANSSCNLNLYLKNINSLNYDLINSDSLTTNFQEFTYTFDLNYSYYNSIGLTEFMFTIDNSDYTLISFDKINLKATFSNFSLNKEGYHNIELKFNRKTSIGTNRGNISFNVKLYQNHFYYDYIENNVIENDYERLNQFVNFTETNIKEVEIQAHVRYGLNTLDIEICNVYYLVMINYNYTFELFEQLRYGNNDGNYFRSEFSYSGMNFNRLINTGIFGNYSSNCLSGLRVLRGTTAINYNRYFLIPYFDEKISLIYAPAGTEGTGSSSEPTLPSGTYWSYETFRLADLGNTPITVENWSVDFRQVYAEKYIAKHPYKEKTIHRRELGDWRFKITDDFKISLNFIRNAVADIINLVLLFLQYIFFLGMASASYVFMFLGINILVLLWNIVVYWLFVGIIWIVWYLYLGLFYLIQGLVWFYEYVIEPFLIWIRDYLLPIIVEFVIYWMSIGITFMIYIITLGQIDFWKTQSIVYDILWLIVIELYIWINTFLDNMLFILLFIVWYLICIIYLYVRYLIARGRGFKENAERYYYTLTFFIIPIKMLFDWIKELLGITPYL